MRKLGLRCKSGSGDPLWGEVAVCLFMTLFTFVAIRQGGLNFGAVAAMAMFWIVGISMVLMGIFCDSGQKFRLKPC